MNIQIKGFVLSCRGCVTSDVAEINDIKTFPCAANIPQHSDFIPAVDH